MNTLIYATLGYGKLFLVAPFRISRAILDVVSW